MKRYLLASFMLIWALPAYAVTLPITEDFEVNTITDLYSKAWNIANSNAHIKNDHDGTKVMQISTTRAHSGTRSLRMQFQGVHALPGGGFDECCDAILTTNFTGVPELWERFWIYFEAIQAPSNWSNPTSKVHYFNVGTVPDFVSDFLSQNPRIAIVNQTPTTHICPPGAGGFPSGDTTCNLNQNVGNVSVQYNRWTCIETHLNQSTVELYVDGTRVVLYTTGNFYPALYTNLQIFRQGGDWQYRYEDDFALATTRIGCGVGQTDITPPATPTGLAVN